MTAVSFDVTFASRDGRDLHVDIYGPAGPDRHRAAVLAQDLRALLPGVRFVPPAGGMHLWAGLPPGTDDVEVARRARQAGVIVMPGQPFFPAEPPGPYLRLTFSAVSTEADLHTGVQRLAGLIRGRERAGDHGT